MTFALALCILQEIDNKYWVSGHSEAEAKQIAANRFDVPLEKIVLVQGVFEYG